MFIKYLSQIEYDFQKSRVTGPWDHKVSVSAKKLKKCHACLTLSSSADGVTIQCTFCSHWADANTFHLKKRIMQQ
jgi:hypothetical protein